MFNNRKNPQQLQANFTVDANIRPHEVATLEGHSSRVEALMVLPSGRLASGSDDKTIKLWEVLSGRCMATLAGHSDWVNALTVLPDGRLASGSRDETIKLWDVASGRCMATLEGHSHYVTALTVLPDGRLASGSGDKTIKLWEVLSGRCMATLAGHSGFVHALTVLPDGRLASGSRDNTIKLWEVLSGRCMATLEGHSSIVYALTALPDGRLASGSWDNTIKLWEVLSGRCMATLEGHSSFVRALTVLPDGRLASGSDDKTIKLWEVLSGRCMATLAGHSDYVYALTVLPDGRLASGSDDKTIKLWEVGLRPTPGRAAASSYGKMESGASRMLEVGQSGTTVVSFKVGDKIEAKWHGKSRYYPGTISAVSSSGTYDILYDDGDKESGVSVDLIKFSEKKTVNKSTGSTALASTASAQEEDIVGDLKRVSIANTEISLGKLLGEGGFGVVHQGRWQLTDVAVKKLKITCLSEAAVIDFKNEAKKHENLRHPNIVALFGICLDPGHYSLVMEYMAQGSLYHVLHSHQALDWSLRYSIARQVATGLSYLHKKKILHRDMKSLNVLLDDGMIAKLSDFGLSKQVKQESSASTSKRSQEQGVGTLLWMAPELLKRGAKHSELSDIYALGVIFWELASRKIPFQDEENASVDNVRAWIKDGERDDIPSDTPVGFKRMIERCWAQRSEDRPQDAAAIALELSATQASGSPVKASADSGLMPFSNT